MNVVFSKNHLMELALKEAREIMYCKQKVRTAVWDDKNEIVIVSDFFKNEEEYCDDGDEAMGENR